MANATLNVTFSISSTDLFSSVNLSKTISDAVTIDGDNRQGLTTMVLSNSYVDINVEALSGTSQGTKKAYVYAKNTDSTVDLIFADDGDQIFAQLSPGEFLYYPTTDNTKIQVKSSSGTPTVEFLLLEVA
jgi:hypothetical protein